MHNKKAVLPTWAVFVYSHNSDTKKISGSFLSFTARNRFLLLAAVRDALPNNPEFLDQSGQLRPFTVLDMRQIRPEDTTLWAERFLTFFSEIVGGGELSAHSFMA